VCPAEPRHAEPASRFTPPWRAHAVEDAGIAEFRSMTSYAMQNIDQSCVMVVNEPSRAVASCLNSLVQCQPAEFRWLAIEPGHGPRDTRHRIPKRLIVRKLHVENGSTASPKCSSTARLQLIEQDVALRVDQSAASVGESRPPSSPTIPRNAPGSWRSDPLRRGTIYYCLYHSRS